MEKVVIIGAGGFGREALDTLEACNQDVMKYEILGFIVDTGYGTPGTIINGKPILGDFHWLENHTRNVKVICAVGAPHQRHSLVVRAQDLNCKFLSIIHPSAIVTRWLTIGEGTIITAGCILSNQITIGCHVHLNPSCTLGHDAVIKDFVSLAPGVLISGNVTMETGCYIGTGTNVIEKLRIGQWSIVGAGSTIISDVPPNSTVVGVPGKVIKTREPGWHLLNNEN